MTRRHPALVAALSFFSFGLYGLYWLYATTDELNEEADRDLTPSADVLLTVLTMGIWGVWAAYRNAKIAHELLEERGVEHSDHSLAVAGFAGMSYFVFGWAWLVSLAILQDDLNRVAKSSEPLSLEERFEQARSYRNVRARVELAEDDFEEAEVVEEESGWDDAPRAPVFRSNAPMPVVF